MRGKASRQQVPEYLGGDHPRICGEKEDAVLFDAGGKGSPPHMRGKDQVGRHFRRVIGITPAYAGKSMLTYPHGCGHWGSPPHMRGKD